MNKLAINKILLSCIISIFLICHSPLLGFPQSDTDTDANFVLDDTNMYWDIFKVVRDGLIKDYEMVSFEPIQVVDKLIEKTIIKTKAKSSILVLINGLNNHNSYIQLSENAELHVLSLKKTDTGELLDCRLEIASGEMILNIENLPATSKFSVKTPYSEATVKGTFFGVNVLPSKIANWAVVRGRIGVKHNRNIRQKSKYVGAGQSLKDGAIGLGNIGADGKAFIERIKQKAKETQQDVTAYAKKKKQAAQKQQKKEKKKKKTDDDKKPKGPDDDNGPGPDDNNNSKPDEGNAPDGEGNKPPIGPDPIKPPPINPPPLPTGVHPLDNDTIDYLLNSLVPVDEAFPPPPPPADGPLEITTPTTWPAASEGHLYTKQLDAKGGKKPYHWYLISMSHPEDKNFEDPNDPSAPTVSLDGVFSGKPPGDAESNVPYKILIEVRDAGGAKVTKEFSLKVSGYRESPGWNSVVSNELDGNGTGTDENGFGLASNEGASASIVFNGYIYIATENNGASAGESTRVYRSSDGTTWSAANTPGFGDDDNHFVSDFAIFNNALYAATSNTNGGELWRTTDGIAWAPANTNGFGDVDNTIITTLAVFNGCLYAGTSNANGSQLFQSSNGTTWSPINTDGFGTVSNIKVDALNVFGNYLYASTTNASGCYIYRSNGGTIWTQIVGSSGLADPGFGDPDNQSVSDMWVFEDFLYAGVTNTASDGCSIWRTSNGTTWENAASGGLGNVNNTGIKSATVFNYWAYVGVINTTNGGKVFRSADGTNWEEAGTTSMWDSANNAVTSLVDFGGRLYAGTAATAGTEVWRLSTVYLDPPISGRVYDTTTGESVPSSIVSIHEYNYDTQTSTLLASSTENPYLFNVNDGLYFLRVNAEGYTFPSTTATSATSGDMGDVFVAEGNNLMTIDLPVDPGYPLEIIKTANKSQAMIGDIVTFNISIRNKSTADISDILIHDSITNGFKMIDGTTYLETEQQTEPTKNGRNLVFPISTVPGTQTINLSYVTRVGVGMEPGRFQTTAFAWSNIHDWRMSNDSVCSVDVIPDPLFTEGTILGKVFEDTNKNGIQDKGEKGIPHAKLVSPKGMIITTDEYGKFHIAGVLPGMHSLKLDTASIEGNVTLTTENPRVIHMTEALPVKMNFGVSIEQPTNKATSQLINQSTKQPENKFFITALGEATARQLSTDNNIEMVNQSDKYDRKFKVEGGLAIYLKGKIKGKYLITASLDTERAPDKYGNSVFKNKLFNNLDPDKYYPVYGDKSEINYDATNTQDELFLLVEWDQSFFKWGSFNTNIPLYNRSLHGANVVYKSIDKTKFGENKTQVNAFAARAFQASAHDEILATGGSLYYTGESNLVEGSEKVKVVLKDPVTQTELSSYALTEEKDYEIDYSQGRILLKKPLSASAFNYNQSIIFNDIARSSVVFLVVDYEYSTFTSIRKEALGAKVSQSIGDHLKIGGTYVQHEKTTEDYQLHGADATYRLNGTTYITAEYNQTKETQMTNNTSITGGLTNTKLTDSISDGKKGHSISVTGETKLFHNTQVKATYSKQDTDFSATGNTSLTGTETYTGEVLTTLKPNLKLGVTHAVQKTASETSASLGSNNKVQTTTAMADYTKNKWDFRVEQQHQEILNKTDDYTWQGTRQLLDHDITAVRAGYKLTNKSKVYAGGQASVNGFNNNQGFIGANLTVDNDTDMSIQETIGNKGDATSLTLSKKIALNSQKSLSMTSGSDQMGKYSQIAQSINSPLTQDTDVYVKHDYSNYQYRMLEGNSIGTETRLSDTLTGNVFYERSHILDEPNAISRDALGGGLAYSEEEMAASTQLEVIKDNGSSDRIQFTTQNKLLWQISQEYETSVRLNYSITENTATDEIEAKFLELGTGLSYRPIDFDKLNLLTKYACIMDQNPINRADFAQAYKDFRHVFALEGIYDLTNKFQLAFKTAYRLLQEKVYPRDWIKSDTYLYLIRLNYHLLYSWDAGLEYRILANRQIEDKKQGFLFEIDRHFGKNFKLGIGYNFTDYSDDLRDNDKYKARGFFIRAIGKY